MRILGVDTSTFALSVGIIEGNEILFDFSINDGNPNAEKLCEIIEKFVDIEKIDVIGVDIGPGSFTGVRIGLAYCKGLAIGKNKPIIGVPSLDAMALTFANTTYKVMPIIDGKMNDVYTATYKNGKRLTTYRAIKIDELIKEINDETLLIGDGVKVYEKWIRNKAKLLQYNPTFPKGIWVAMECEKRVNEGKFDNPNDLEPIYLHPPRIILKR